MYVWESSQGADLGGILYLVIGKIQPLGRLSRS